MSPQMLILPKSGSNIDQFLAEHYNFQKNIGPVEDSMSYWSITNIAYSSEHMRWKFAVLSWSHRALTSTVCSYKARQLQ
jgi:hypothetical protein